MILMVCIMLLITLYLLFEEPLFEVISTRMLEVGIETKEYIPKYCDNYQNHVCHVIKKGYVDRMHCYDIDFPFYLKLQRYSCNNHYFNILNERVIEQLPSTIQSNIPLLVLDKLVVVK
jgi:hypothetical protein